MKSIKNKHSYLVIEEVVEVHATECHSCGGGGSVY